MANPLEALTMEREKLLRYRRILSRIRGAIERGRLAVEEMSFYNQPGVSLYISAYKASEEYFERLRLKLGIPWHEFRELRFERWPKMRQVHIEASRKLYHKEISVVQFIDILLGAMTEKVIEHFKQEAEAAETQRYSAKYNADASNAVSESPSPTTLPASKDADQEAEKAAEQPPASSEERKKDTDEVKPSSAASADSDVHGGDSSSGEVPEGQSQSDSESESSSSCQEDSSSPAGNGESGQSSGGSTGEGSMDDPSQEEAEKDSGLGETGESKDQEEASSETESSEHGYSYGDAPCEEYGGDFVDYKAAAEAITELQRSKELKQAAYWLSQLVHALDAGFGEMTPKWHGKRLVKEIVSRRVCLNRARRTDFQKRTAYVYVDVSGSCACSATQMYSVAVALSATTMKNRFVAVRHSNGCLYEMGVTIPELTINQLVPKYGAPGLFLFLGDMDAVLKYKELTETYPDALVLWFDNFCCSKRDPYPCGQHEIEGLQWKRKPDFWYHAVGRIDQVVKVLEEVVRMIV